jgi:hypothetical protein
MHAAVTFVMPNRRIGAAANLGSSCKHFEGLDSRPAGLGGDRKRTYIIVHKPYIRVFP